MSGWDPVPSASSELSSRGSTLSPFKPNSGSCKPSRPGSEAHLGQPAPPGPTQAHLPAHRQHVVELFERRLPAVPELKAEHDDTLADLQFGRPKYHSGLDAWGGRGQPLSVGEAEVERGRGARKELEEYVPALAGPSLMGKAQSPARENSQSEGSRPALEEPPVYQADRALDPAAMTTKFHS